MQYFTRFQHYTYDRVNKMIFLTLQAEYSQSRLQHDDALFEQLIQDMAHEDVQALEKLYTQSKSAVYGFALSILRHPQDAEDVMQDAYVKIYYGANTYQPQGKPMAWILTIVRNLALMRIRQAKKSQPIDEINDISDWDCFADQSIDRMILEAVFSTLANEERQIIMLHSIGGMKHREIAEILEIPLSTVLSKYKRSLSKLRKTLEGGGIQ